MRICKAASVFGLAMAMAVGWARAGAFGPAAQPLSSDRDVEIFHLRQAYVDLETADQDYRGHRAAALRAVGDACGVLGSDAQSDGANHPAPGNSDGLLISALAELTSIAPPSTSPRQDRAMELVREAEEQINLALAGDDPAPVEGGRRGRRARRRERADHSLRRRGGSPADRPHKASPRRRTGTGEKQPHNPQTPNSSSAAKPSQGE